LHQHRPRQSTAGRRNHRRQRILAVAFTAAAVVVTLVVAIFAFVLTRDDEGEAAADPDVVTLSAKDLVPDLSAMGYKMVDEFSQPLKVPGQDNFRRAFVRNGDSARVALVDVTVHATEAGAQTAYAQAAEQWRNPPPGVFGGIESFEQTPSPAVGDEQRSYVSSNSDRAGNRAWTDVYRAGTVVFVVQVLDRGDSDQLELRGQIAAKVADQLP
jgi:hypothetical protein